MRIMYLLRALLADGCRHYRWMHSLGHEPQVLRFGGQDTRDGRNSSGSSIRTGSGTATLAAVTIAIAILMTILIAVIAIQCDDLGSQRLQRRSVRHAVRSRAGGGERRTLRAVM